jgi:1,4-alpha-glucan branching enzyme
MPDAFAFVLHGHLPYARAAGRWPHGEEWIHEAILGTYLPLLVQLYGLRDEGIAYRLTLGLTPVLLEQLADADITERFGEYAADQMRRAEEDVRRFSELGDYPLESLAARYLKHYESLIQIYRKRFDRDLVGAFADLQRTGHVEILTSAATHGYLPLLRRPAAIRGQLLTGLASTRRLLGIEPSGMWLPECAYAPGLERYIEDAGITHFFVDAALFAGQSVDVSGREFTLAGDVAARFGRWASGDGGPREWPTSAEAYAGEPDVLQPYLVGSSRVAAIARHPRVSGQVWSAAHGYPGDGSYREFHRKDEISGLRYWRVTDRESDLGQKQTYDWEAALDRARSHAHHFVELARGELAAHRSQTGRDGLLVASFDLELFGHWWFEGVHWLGATLRAFARGAPSTTSVAAHLGAAPPQRSVSLREGSWGKDNDHSTWLNDQTAWMWPELERRSILMEELASVGPGSALGRRAAAQAARELLLAQSSDWEFLISTGQAAAYARERFRVHLLRFERAVAIARDGSASAEAEIAALERADNPFPDIDWAVYREVAEVSVRPGAVSERASRA